MVLRNGAIDLTRFFGILLMVMGHVWLNVIFGKWIHGFHMSLWFIISGYFMTLQKVSDKGTFDYIFSKFKGILVPYILFGGGYEIIYISLTGDNNRLGLVYPNSVCVTLNGALWFLPALFFTDVIGFTALKYFGKKQACILLAALGIIGNLHLVALPFSMDSALVGCGFLLIGFIIRNYGMGLLKLKLPVSIVLLFGASVLILVNGYVNMRTNDYSIIPLFWMNATFMTIALWNICRWVDEHIEFCVLKEIGAESLIYVCTNQFILILLNKILPLQFSNIVFMFMWHMVEVIIIIAIGFIANRIIKKMPLKIILGK